MAFRPFSSCTANLVASLCDNYDLDSDSDEICDCDCAMMVFVRALLIALTMELNGTLHVKMDSSIAISEISRMKQLCVCILSNRLCAAVEIDALVASDLLKLS